MRFCFHAIVLVGGASCLPDTWNLRSELLWFEPGVIHLFLYKHNNVISSCVGSSCAFTELVVIISADHTSGVQLPALCKHLCVTEPRTDSLQLFEHKHTLDHWNSSLGIRLCVSRELKTLGSAAARGHPVNVDQMSDNVEKGRRDPVWSRVASALCRWPPVTACWVIF